MDVSEHPRSDQDRLLIVDDDRHTRLLLKGVLSRQGFLVSEAADGAQAVQLFERERPTVVLLDVMMPVMDGFEACSRMRDLDQDEGTPIIMLTGAEDLSAIDQAFDAGATDFITKPINWTLLTQRVRYALRTGALNREVRQNRLRQASARRIAKLAFWEWRLGDDSLHWSDDLAALLGVPSQALDHTQGFLAVVHPDDRGRAQRVMDLVREGEGQIEVELRLRTGERERLIRLVGERGIQGSDNDIVFGAFQDVTDTRQTEALVDYLAFHDELTDLGNRRLFLRQVTQALTGLDTDRILLVGWVDVSRFHRHNDALGEDAGDWLLTKLARRLRQLVAAPGAVARVGGDEFAVMFLDTQLASAVERFEGILMNLKQPFQIGGQETILTFSSGIACFPEHGTDANHLLNLAQDAQRLARNQARSLVVAMPDAQASARFTETLAVERDLHNALDNQEFFLNYQPQMNLRTGRIVGVEALLRWRHPERGLIPPSRFIPLLENLGLIAAVGRWVLEQACQQSARWTHAGIDLRVGINLSPRQFLEPSFYDEIQDTIRAAGAIPSRIELEITESLAMQNPVHAIELLTRCRAGGLKVAIDDFGIGHSSLEYLLRFPIDTIKIDRAFVMNITNVQADRAIVRAVTAIGQTLGLGIVAEGVETLRQCDFVEALGVTEVQGYLIGRPMEPTQIEILLRDFTRPGLDAV